MLNGILSSAIALSPVLLAQVASNETGQAPGGTMTAVIWALVALTAISVIFNQIAQSWRTMTGKFAEKPATGGSRSRDDCLGIHKALNVRLKEMETESRSSDDKLRAEIKSDLNGLFSRMNSVQQQLSGQTAQVLEAVGELRGQLKGKDGG